MAVRAWMAAGLIVLAVIVAALPALADPTSFPVPSLDPNVLASEGGCSRDPHDPGNAGGTITLNGVIQRVYDAYLDGEGRPRVRLACAMERTAQWKLDRTAIYRERYWQPCAGPDLPRGLDFGVFSMCVNAGIKRGWVLLMRALGLLDRPPYARMPDVLAAIEARGVRAVIHGYGDQRRAFYRAIAPSTNGRFLNGWLTRETRERNAALAMASGTRTGATVAPLPPGLLMGKAVEDAAELMEVWP